MSDHFDEVEQQMHDDIREHRENGQVGTIVSWFPCRACQNEIEYNHNDLVPEHWVECNTCGYSLFFSVDISENEARELWNKLVAN